VNQQALQRASNSGGGSRSGAPCSSVRGLPSSTQSFAQPGADAVGQRHQRDEDGQHGEATSPPLNIFIELSICWPRPPAPTKPSTTELRMAHSQR
jgi:hypothetical protein